MTLASLRLIPLSLILLATATHDAAAATKYSKLARVGVKAGTATVDARKLTVTLRLRQRAQVELAVVSGTRVLARAKAKTLKKGRRRLAVTLNRAPSGESLRLRITVKNLVTRKRGRGFAKLKLIARPHPRFVGGVTANGGNTTTQYLVNSASATGGYFNTSPAGTACPTT